MILWCCGRARELNGTYTFHNDHLAVLHQQFERAQSVAVTASVFVHHMGCLFRNSKHTFLSKTQPRRGNRTQQWHIQPYDHPAVPFLQQPGQKRKREE